MFFSLPITINKPKFKGNKLFNFMWKGFKT